MNFLKINEVQSGVWWAYVIGIDEAPGISLSNQECLVYNLSGRNGVESESYASDLFVFH